ncbi:hypothetical protein [Myxosarcina sp. GI1(2024)]
MPVIIKALIAFGIVRFVGMGTGNKGLYITGGVCLQIWHSNSLGLYVERERG